MKIEKDSSGYTKTVPIFLDIIKEITHGTVFLFTERGNIFIEFVMHTI